jgi:starch phosphorylase
VSLPRSLPEGLEPLADLALDLRWTWSHAGDTLWQALHPEAWERTRNPWLILQDVSTSQLERLAGDARFMTTLRELATERQRYLGEPGWFGRTHPDAQLGTIAYFSMEFGLSESLPLYAGGLGILAGDYLKAASDLGVPLVGLGPLYQEGYFRQMLDAAGEQLETYPYNDPASLPIQPVLNEEGAWLHIPLELPGRTLLVRVWRANVGRIKLYLLDTNDPLNSPADRGITGKLYGGGTEMRLLQEMVLGIGGWRTLEALGIPVDVCHLNEGHAAFAVIERARRWMQQTDRSFQEALWATRAGNVFTTHTPVRSGFDVFPPELIQRYFPDPPDLAACLLAMGRRDPGDPREPVNMAYLAMRGCSNANGVSRLHGAVSRGIFQTLYPRWPQAEVPIGSITNGVHVPSWDSAWADTLWTEACGKERWRRDVESLGPAIARLTDEALWTFRVEQARDLIRYTRRRLARQLGQRGAEAAEIERAAHVLDPNVLTIGFARRFTEYKRPTLLLHDPGRLSRLLTDMARPVQLIVAGKAHPADAAGKRIVRAWVEFVTRPAVRRHAVFLEDYDMVLAQELAEGVDVWINTPRRPWEACGTSGMKILVNGGLNLSVLDGWWAEAYAPEVGWALGEGQEHPDAQQDAAEAAQLYSMLEHQVIPEFYDRDAQGIPRAWLARVRASMSRLAPQFSSTRMLREYVEAVYLPAAPAHRRRVAEGGRLAAELCAWRGKLETSWAQVRFGMLEVRRDGDRCHFTVQVYLGEIEPEWIRVELYAEPTGGEGQAYRAVMERFVQIPGVANGFGYWASVPASRPAEDFTPRVIPFHPEARIPIEANPILWQR